MAKRNTCVGSAAGKAFVPTEDGNMIAVNVEARESVFTSDRNTPVKSVRKLLYRVPPRSGNELLCLLMIRKGNFP